MADTDVIIVGAGPTGLMLACQLSRFGINFRIIDKERERTQESRAIGIQAKSMEIFQNLNIVDQFIKKAKTPKEASIYFNNKVVFRLCFQKMDIKGTPYSKVFLLPQSETEKIFSTYLEKLNIPIERETELESFIQTREGIEAQIKNYSKNTIEKIKSRFIVGCDGAKSKVREIMNVPFEGGSYQQEFILADVAVHWKYPKDIFALFNNKKGLFVHIPLNENYSRLIICKIDSFQYDNDASPTNEYIENFARNEMGLDIKLEKPFWSSHFHLHHRAVKQYFNGFAFLAGDAAHIHSPVAGQGMNTGLQDASNLAWKLALVLKYKSSSKLLDTYQIERIKVGKKLLATTDRIFGFLTSKNIIILFFKQYFFPILLYFFNKSDKIKKRIFCFMSELAIHYPPNSFIIEYSKGADELFLKGPKAGSRAPDCSLKNVNLFEKLSEKPFNILLFQKTLLDDSQENIISKIEGISPVLIAIQRYLKSEDNQALFDTYGVKNSAIYFIRPDGYIGFRAYGYQFSELWQFLSNLFNKTKP